MPIGEWQIQFAEEADRQDLIGGYQIARPSDRTLFDILGLSGWSTANAAPAWKNFHAP
jgi:hypothetical protein